MTANRNITITESDAKECGERKDKTNEKGKTNEEKQKKKEKEIENSKGVRAALYYFDLNGGTHHDDGGHTQASV